MASSPVPLLTLGAVPPEATRGHTCGSAASDRVSAALGALGDVSNARARWDGAAFLRQLRRPQAIAVASERPSLLQALQRLLRTGDDFARVTCLTVMGSLADDAALRIQLLEGGVVATLVEVLRTCSEFCYGAARELLLRLLSAAQGEGDEEATAGVAREEGRGRADSGRCRSAAAELLAESVGERGAAGTPERRVQLMGMLVHDALGGSWGVGGASLVCTVKTADALVQALTELTAAAPSSAGVELVAAAAAMLRSFAGVREEGLDTRQLLCASGARYALEDAAAACGGAGGAATCVAALAALGRSQAEQLLQGQEERAVTRLQRNYRGRLARHRVAGLRRGECPGARGGVPRRRTVRGGGA
jgi:hypothetical protein